MYFFLYNFIVIEFIVKTVYVRLLSTMSGWRPRRVPRPPGLDSSGRPASVVKYDVRPAARRPATLRARKSLPA